MKNFKYNTPTKIIFGRDTLSEIVNEIPKYGQRVLLVYGGGSIKKNRVYNQLTELLIKNKLFYTELSGVKPNPSIISVREGITICRENKVDFILAVGGGSVIDCAKAIAAGVFYKGDPWDFYTGKAKIRESLPLGTVLTLSATGSEMNGFSVISNEETRQKLGTGSELLKPKFSILNPEHTFSVNEYQTAAGTADIISHCLEQYFSPQPGTYLQDRITEAIIKTCIHYGPIALKDPGNYEARANLMWASSLALNGMISTGKEGDWATHDIEHKISALTDLAHGVGLAIITPAWMAEVLDEENVDKFFSLGCNVFGIDPSYDKHQVAQESIKLLRFFFLSLGIPETLSKANASVSFDKFDEMAEDILSFGPIGVFKKLEKEAIIRILKAIS
jgi:alcohol dehydrogenase YqhD (iron-dependent ADH family)